MFKKNSSTPPPRPSMSIIQRLIGAYKLWHEYISHFPKDTKYTLGSKIDSLFIETAGLLFTASYLSREAKLPVIIKANGTFDLLKFFLQVAWEIKSLDNIKYIAISQQLDEIGRMLGAWHKQLLTQIPSR